VRRFDTWQSVCPSCLVGGWTLTLCERGVARKIDVRCAAGCTETETRQALEVLADHERGTVP
jgi:hypothetical protein